MAYNSRRFIKHIDDYDRVHRLEIQQQGYVESGLVSAWHFDGDVTDSIGSNDGTINGDPQFVEGVSGQALEFDGVGDYVEMANSTGVNLDTTKEFSLTAWIKATDSGGDSSVLALLGDNQSRFDLNNGPVYIYRDDSGIFRTERLPGTTLDGQWHHVVWVISNSVFYGYVDGVLAGSANLPNPNTGSFGEMTLAKGQGSSNNLNGLIDEPRIYNRALSESEIQDLYNSPSGGTSIKANKGSGAFQFEHEDVTDENGYLKVYANPIQKGMLEVYPLIEDSTDYALLTDIFQSDEDEFRLVWKIDGSVYWTGYVLNDLLEFEESSYPYTSTIVAKDFSRLKGMDYTLDDTRQTWITTIADLLSYLNLGLDIDTATSWTESHLDSSITGDYDYLNHIYHETKALREFGRTGDEDPQPISVYEALERVLSDNCLILKQIDGKYQIDHLSAYKDPSSVLVSTYDSTGTQTAQTAVDKTLTYNRNNMRVKTQGSKSKGFVAIKRAKVKFNHRTQVTNIQFPSVFEAVESFEQFFVSDGDQEIILSGNCRATLDDENDTAEGRIIIQAGSYYWDEENGQWDDSGSVTNGFPLRVGHIGVGTKDFQGSFSFVTNPTPPDADGLITITFNNALGDFSGSSDTEYSNCSFDIRNPIADQNSKYILYQLTQTGGFSEGYEHADAWFGDGPIQYSPGALRYDTGNTDNTSDSWQRRGTTSGYRNFAENQLKEILDIQRSFVFRKEAAMWGLYDATKVLQYRSGNYYYTGGTFKGATGDWGVRIMDVNVQTDATDVFDDIPKFADESVQGSGSSQPDPGGGDGVTDHGALTGLDDDDHPQYLNEARGDARYLQIAQNLSDLSSITTAQANLGLKDGSADLNFNSLTVGDNVVFHNNGYAYYNVAGENFSFMTDADTRNVWDIRRGSIGDTGATNRLWGVAITSTDNLRFNPETGGAVDFMSDINVQGESIFQDAALFNDRITAANGNLIFHENGYAYYDVSGGNFSFMTDFNSRSVWGIRRGSVGDTGSTNRLWAVRATSSDNLYFDPEAGGNLISDRYVINDWAGSESYVSGILGAGSRWDMDTSGGTFFEIDNMRVRNELRAHIFKKEIVKASNAYLFISDAAEIAEEVKVLDSSATFKIVDDEMNANFSPGDLLWLKSINDEGSLDINGVKFEVGSQVGSGTTNGKDWIEYSINSTERLGTMRAGDTIVRVSGGYLLNDASSQYSPFLDIYDGVNTWSDFQSVDKLKARYGNLEGITWDGTSLSGYGIFTAKGRFTDDIVIGDLSETSNYLKFDGSSFEVNADTFNLESTYIRISDIGVGLIRVGETGQPQVGLTGFTAAWEIAFWAGSSHSNRNSAPVWIKGNGDARFAGGVLTASGSTSEVGLASFTADTESLYTTSGVAEVAMGYPNGYSTSVFGFHVGQDEDNRIFAGRLGDDENHEISFFKSADLLFRVSSLDSRGNRIAGSYFDADAMWGGDPNMTDGSVIINWASSYISLPKASDGTRGRIDSSGITLPSVSDQAINWAYPASSGVTDASIYTDDADMFIYGHGHLGNVRSITIEPNPSDYGYGLTNIGGMLTLYDKDDSYPTATSGTTSITGISRSRVYLTASGGPTISTMTTQQSLKDGMILFITLDRSGSNMYFDYTSTGNISTRNNDPQELLPGGTIFFIYDADINRWSMQQDRN